MSNAAIAGLRDITLQEFGYGRAAVDGVELVFAAAETIDAAARAVTVAGGQRLEYDRLVLSPGIDFRWEALPGYSREAATTMPHAWIGGGQIALLARQIASMDDGGVVVISVPVTPSRCPPAPYERASLIAHMLKTKKPRSKVIVLDAKDSFTMQRQFQNAWKQLYPGVLEYVSLSDGGVVTSVEVATRTVTTDFDKYTPAVANIIPQQKAGRIAEIAGVADRTGWCPVDPITFESRLQPNIHVIGDAAIAGAMPRSASAATSQAKICAAAVATLLAGNTPPTPTLASSCFSLIAPNYAISQSGRYQPVGDNYTEVDGSSAISPVDAPPGPACQGSARCRGLVHCDDHRGVRMRGRVAVAMVLALAGTARAEELRPYQISGGAIAASLTGAPGDAARGRAIVLNRTVGLCLLCHSGPFPEERFQGNLAPDLSGTGARWSIGELRLRMVDSHKLNADTIMPAYYAVDGLNRVAPAFRGKPLLTAGQIEDVVAFLATLRDR